MTIRTMTEQARTAIALVAYLTDDPDADDAVTEWLYRDTCVEAALHLAACLVRDVPGANEYLRRVALRLARQESES